MPVLTTTDRFNATDKKNQTYSDFLINMNRHPVTGDIVRFVNEQAVVRAIKNLLLTNRGERLMQPEIGSNIQKLLFEPMDPSVASELSSMIRTTIDSHEPRAKVVGVVVEPDYDKNLYNVSVKILVINKQDPISFNLMLTRVR